VSQDRHAGWPGRPAEFDQEKHQRNQEQHHPHGGNVTPETGNSEERRLANLAAETFLDPGYI